MFSIIDGSGHVAGGAWATNVCVTNEGALRKKC